MSIDELDFVQKAGKLQSLGVQTEYDLYPYVEQ